MPHLRHGFHARSCARRHCRLGAAGGPRPRPQARPGSHRRSRRRGASWLRVLPMRRRPQHKRRRRRPAPPRWRGVGWPSRSLEQSIRGAARPTVDSEVAGGAQLVDPALPAPHPGRSLGPTSVSPAPTCSGHSRRSLSVPPDRPPSPRGLLHGSASLQALPPARRRPGSRRQGCQRTPGPGRPGRIRRVPPGPPSQASHPPRPAPPPGDPPRPGPAQRPGGRAGLRLNGGSGRAPVPPGSRRPAEPKSENLFH